MSYDLPPYRNGERVSVFDPLGNHLVDATVEDAIFATGLWSFDLTADSGHPLRGIPETQLTPEPEGDR